MSAMTPDAGSDSAAPDAAAHPWLSWGRLGDALVGAASAFTLSAYAAPAFRPRPWLFALILGGLALLLTRVARSLRVRCLMPRLAGSSRRARAAWVGGSLLGGLLLVTVIPVPEPTMPLWVQPAPPATAGSPAPPTEALGGKHLKRLPRSLSWAYRSLAVVTPVVSIGVVLLLVGVWLTGLSPTAAEGLRWGWLGYALCCATVWTVYLLLFWPGLINADAYDQWYQAEKGPYVDHHPVFHTFCISLVMRLWHNPAALAVAQIVGLSAVVGWGLAVARRGGMPRWLAALLCLVIALTPANGVMAISPTKDTAFTVALLAFTFLIIETVRSDGAWLRRRWSWVWLGLAGALTALFRANGLIAVVGALLLLLVCYRPFWRRSACALGLIALVWAGYRGPFCQWLKVQPSYQMPFANFLAMHHIGAHVAAGEPLAPQEQALLDQLRRPGMGWPYRPDNGDLMIYDGRFDFATARRLSNEMVRLAVDLDFRYPKTALKHLAGSSSYLWRILPVPPEEIYGICLWLDDKRQVHTMDTRFDTSAFPPRSFFPDWQWSAAAAIEHSYLSPPWSWLLWRPALYLYVGLAAGLIAVARGRSLRWLLVLAPVLLNTASIALLAACQAHRYGYPLQLVVMVVAGSLFLGVPRKPAAAAHHAGAPVLVPEPRPLAA